MAKTANDEAPPPQVIINPGIGYAPPSSVGAPLFPGMGKGPNVPEKVKVWREDPADGYLGTISADSDEEAIRARWGGRVFRLEAINAMGRAIPGGKRTLTIQDEPRLPGGQKPAAPPPAPAGPQFDAVAFMQGQLDLERQRAEQAENKARRELEAYVTRLRAENEEREKQEAARHRRDMELERERAASSRQESKEFMATMMQMQQSANTQMTTVITAALGQNKAADPMAFASMFERGIQLASGMNQQDPGVEIAKTLTGGLSSFAQLALADRSAAAQQPQRPTVRNSPAAPRRVQQPPQALPAAAPAQQAPAPAGEKIERIKTKAGNLFQQIAAEGHDPEQVLDALLSGEIVLRSAGDEDDDPDDGETLETRPEDAPEHARAQAPHRAESDSRSANGSGAKTPPLADGGAEHR
jgi:hypothetical protein